MTQTCVCWWCEEPGTVELELLHSCAGDSREWFCEKDAAAFERMCWQRVKAQVGEQLELTT